MDTTASSRRTVDQSLVARVVSSYVRKNAVPPADMPTLISTVYQSLLTLGQPPVPEPPTPAVPIRQSVTRNHVVCLECGWRGQALRRHIQVQHGLSRDDYRARWGLPSHHALVAPAYSQRRAGIAKELGLGQRERRSPSAETAARPARRQSQAESDATPDPGSAS
jgi:predicted transcriptional regulator